MFSLIYAWINDWVNNREAGDLRRQHGHYDVIVMKDHEITTLHNDIIHDVHCNTSAMYQQLIDDYSEVSGNSHSKC